MPLPDDRRASLNETKLAALVRDRGRSGGDASSSASMALLDSGGCTYAYLAEPARRDLGMILVRAAASTSDEVVVFVDDAERGVAAELARRASHYAMPIEIALVTGRDTSVVPAAPFGPHVEPSGSALALQHVLHDAGLDVLVEHGVIKGEVLGLEVARIVADPTAAAGARVEVGIGRFDREIAQMMHGEDVGVAHVVAAADLVRSHRYPGAPVHPLRDLVPERWLRTRLVADPTIVGCDGVRPIDGATDPPNLRDRCAAMAEGTNPDGTSVCIGTTVGVDLDAVTEAADGRAFAGMSGPFVMVVTEGDLPAAVRAAASRLIEPPEWVTCPRPW